MKENPVRTEAEDLQIGGIGSGQVLMSPYPFDKTKLVVREMTDLLALDLVDKGLVTDQIVLTVGYDIENLKDPERRKSYKGSVTTDHYGRAIPKHAHGTANLGGHTSSARNIMQAVLELFDRIVDKKLLARRITVAANHVISETAAPKAPAHEQLDLFTDYGAEQARRAEEEAELEREKRMQQAILKIKKKYGKNAILKGVNFEEGATAKNRNEQIGGHRA
jgi:DNA polymerase V